MQERKQMNENLLVSIIIPVYNGSNYLCEAMDSALAQTYKDIEIIVVNDGSTDNTEDICLSYGDKIRYFKKENGGVATALNFAVKQMRGAYFSWLSHDDIYYPEKIALQINALESDGDYTKVVFGDYAVLKQPTGNISTERLNENYSESRLTDSLFPVLQALLIGATLLVHKSHFERVGMFNENLRYTQDYDMWFRIFQNQKTLYINKPLYISRRHEKQDSEVHVSGLRTEQLKMVLGFAEKLNADEIKHFYGSRFMFLYILWWRYKQADMNNTELENEIRTAALADNIKSIIQDYTGNKKIYIFGAGLNGRYIYYMLKFCGVGCYGFLDNNYKLNRGTVVDDVKCFLPAEMPDLKEDVVCIISPYDFVGIDVRLRSIGINNILSKHKFESLLCSCDKE
jgi:glycosyltransferase involved in cell wall biosynthesis